MLAGLEPLASSTAAYVFVVVLGLLWGSFANVCIYRWPPSEEFPDGRSVVAPGSHCTACKAPIRWYDNVPLLAWLWLRGRCRACGAAFSPRYLVVEALTGALFGVAWWAAVIAPAMFEPFDQRLFHFAVYAAFCTAMVVIMFIDLDHQLILNKVTVPGIIVLYAVSLAWPDRTWYDGLIGIAIGYGVPWSIGEIYYRIHKREAMGLGDSMLLAMVGALLGWRGVVVALFAGSVIGTVVVLSGLAVRQVMGRREAEAADTGAGAASKATTEANKSAGEAAGDAAAEDASEEAPSFRHMEIPFGTFLAAGAMLYLFAEPWIHLQFHLPGG